MTIHYIDDDDGETRCKRLWFNVKITNDWSKCDCIPCRRTMTEDEERAGDAK